jgi:hypothetical protein
VAETKIDPYDVAALEKSLNDSATRVSTIWVSFLIFSLYLLIAAATVTHRQLFLAEPVKLPVLNIDLPLWGRAGPGCLNRISASISGASAGVRLPCGVAAG